MLYNAEKWDKVKGSEHHMWKNITIPKAAKALRGYLETGVTKWEAV